MPILSKPLTDRQARVLAFICECNRRNGYPPTLREIAKAMGIRSINAVQTHLLALQRKGHIERQPGCSRAIRVLAAHSESEAAHA